MKHFGHQRRHFRPFLARVNRCFIQCLAGCTEADIAYLFSEETAAVYYFDQPSRTAYMQGYGGCIPWPIVWMLSRHSKKFRFSSMQKPNIDGIMQGIRDWGEKVKWRWSLRNSTQEQNSIRRRVVGTGRPTRVCSDPKVPMDLKAWIGTLGRFLGDPCRAALRNAPVDELGMKLAWHNTSQLLKVATSFLKHSGLAAFPTDKDGGFACLDRNRVGDELLRGLTHDKYLEIPAYIGTVSVKVRGYKSICKSIVKATGDKSLLGALESQLVGGTFVSELQGNIKTHKGPGKVKFRLLHDCSRLASAPLGRWISAVIRPLLFDKYLHIATDTKMVIRMLSKVVFI